MRFPTAVAALTLPPCSPADRASFSTVDADATTVPPSDEITWAYMWRGVRFTHKRTAPLRFIDARVFRERRSRELVTWQKLARDAAKTAVRHSVYAQMKAAPIPADKINKGQKNGVVT